MRWHGLLAEKGSGIHIIRNCLVYVGFEQTVSRRLLPFYAFLPLAGHIFCEPKRRDAEKNPSLGGCQIFAGSRTLRKNAG